MSPSYSHTPLSFVSSVSAIVVARLRIGQTISSRTVMVEGWRFKVYLSCSRPATSSRKISEYIIVLKDMGLETYAFEAWPHRSPHASHHMPLTTAY